MHGTDDGGEPGAGIAAGTLHEAAYRRLEEMIVTLKLGPGEVVSEASLGRQLGIGTTPVREALQRLSREYLVQILPRRGVVVTAIDVRLQLQVLETRRELDRLIVRSAARRATAAERQDFAALAAGIAAHAAGSDRRAFLQLDGELNERLAQAARNQVAADTVATLHAVARRFWYFHHQVGPGLADTIALHAEIARAVAEGNPVEAGAGSDRLMDHLVAFARATLSES